jgi:hypothetical protein
MDFCFSGGWVMHARTVAILTAMCLCLSSHQLAAQPRVRSVNPEAIDFDIPTVDQPEQAEYRVEVFQADSDIHVAAPIKSIDLARRDFRDNGTFRLDLTSALNDVPDGNYVATVRATSGTQTVQTGPGETFVLSRHRTPEDRSALERRERFWTKIGLGIGAAILLVPLVLR